LPFLFFVGLKIAHFTRFHFSLGFKSLISAVFIFRWSLLALFPRFSKRKITKKSHTLYHPYAILCLFNRKWWDWAVICDESVLFLRIRNSVPPRRARRLSSRRCSANGGKAERV